MNDFTKEELSILDDCMIIAIDEYNVAERIFEVKEKLESIIDNYCEHDFHQLTCSHNQCKSCGAIK